MPIRDTYKRAHPHKDIVTSSEFSDLQSTIGINAARDAVWAIGRDEAEASIATGIAGLP